MKNDSGVNVWQFVISVVVIIALAVIGFLVFRKKDAPVPAVREDAIPTAVVDPLQYPCDGNKCP